MKEILRIERYAHESFKGTIDSPTVGNRVDPAACLIEGWVVSKSPIKKMQLISDGGVVQEFNLTVRRPIVREKYKEYYHSDNAGYSTAIADFGRRELSLWICLEDGSRQRLARFIHTDVEMIKTKKVLYVHIAKTAGSSLNKFFVSQLGTDNSLIHLESEIMWRDSQCIHRVKSKCFISGHLRYDEFKAKLNVKDYYKIITFRDPVDHIISHLAWIRHLSEEKHRNRLLQHPEYIQDLSHKLSETDFTSAREMRTIVGGLTKAQRALLDNTQTFYLAAIKPRLKIDRDDLDYACQQLCDFEVVGMVEEYDVMVEKICHDLGWIPPEENRKENIGESKYGLSSDNFAVLNVLEPLICWDNQLHQTMLRENRNVKGR